MHPQPVSCGIRRIGTACLAVALSLRPLIADSMNPRLAAALDLACLIAASVVMLASLRQAAALRYLLTPLACWSAGFAATILWHGGCAMAMSDCLALAGGPVICVAASAPWGRWRKRFPCAAAALAAAIGMLAIAQYAIIMPAIAEHRAADAETAVIAIMRDVASRRRPPGTFELPTLLAAYLSAALALLYHQLTRTRHGSRPWLWLSAGAILPAWALARSLGVLAATAAACAIAWLPRRPARKHLALGLGALLALSVLFYATRPELRDYTSPHNPLRNRLAYWHAAIRLIAAHPITGMGPGSFGPAYRESTTTPHIYARYAHNTYLQLWAEYGLLGFAGWLWLIASILRAAPKKSPWLAAAVWLFPLINCIDFSFYRSQASLLWWYAAGWALRRHSAEIRDAFNRSPDIGGCRIGWGRGRPARRSR